LATKVALEERRISALTRKIEDLEWKDLPAANLVRSEAEHQAALRSASALHEQWLAEAKELADLGAQLSRRWLSFHQREQLYADACYRAGYEAKPLNRAAVIALVSALVPPLIDELSRTYEIGVASGDGPVATVQNRAMSRLRRQSN
jgi:hypothetical protein